MNSVRITHHKTGVLVWMPLEDDDGPFFEHLTTYLDGLSRLGDDVVHYQPFVNPHNKTRGPARLYSRRDARSRVRKAARDAGLPDWLTLDACRHGGMVAWWHDGARRFWAQ